MSGEDPWDPGPWTSNFRVKCPECGKQVQFANGLRAEPDCGHDLDSVRVEMDTRKANAARPRLALVESPTQKCLIHMEPDVDHCRGCAADRKAAESA